MISLHATIRAVVLDESVCWRISVGYLDTDCRVREFATGYSGSLPGAQAVIQARTTDRYDTDDVKFYWSPLDMQNVCTGRALVTVKQEQEV